MNIAFGWTLEAVLKGEKTITRREWSESHANSIRKDDIVSFSDKDIHLDGILYGKIRIIEDPFLQHYKDMNAFDFNDEGFIYLATCTRVSGYSMNPDSQPNERLLDAWETFLHYKHNVDKEVWVVKFHLEEIFEDLSDKKDLEFEVTIQPKDPHQLTLF